MQEGEGACFHIWQDVLLLTKCQDSNCGEHFKVDEPGTHIPGWFIAVATRCTRCHNSLIYHIKVVTASVEAKHAITHTMQ